MKKILSIVAVAMVMCLLCVGLVACDNTENDYNNAKTKLEEAGYTIKDADLSTMPEELDGSVEKAFGGMKAENATTYYTVTVIVCKNDDAVNTVKAWYQTVIDALPAEMKSTMKSEVKGKIVMFGSTVAVDLIL